MATNETLNGLFEMLIERLQGVEHNCEKMMKKKHMVFENMCHCQISTLEVTNDSFKFIAKSPVFNCPTCGYKGYSTLKNDAG